MKTDLIKNNKEKKETWTIEHSHRPRQQVERPILEIISVKLLVGP